MEDNVRNNAAEWGPPNSEIASTDRRSPFVRFCTWCKEICFRPPGMRQTDSILISVFGSERRAFWNGREIIVADGICEKCRAEKFAEYPVPVKGTPENQPAGATPATKEHQP